MTQPPKSTAPITNPLENEISAANWTGENPAAYEILRREGEIHEGRRTVTEELRTNITRLEELHGELKFLLKEVQGVLRR